MTRNTIQRELVRQAVQNLRHHPTADEIHAHIVKNHPTVSKATVYRNLAQLVAAGQVRRVSHLNAADRFDFLLEPHYHFRCRACGKVFDAALPYDAGLLPQTEGPDGFLYEAHELTFTGLCPHCRTIRGAGA